MFKFTSMEFDLCEHDLHNHEAAAQANLAEGFVEMQEAIKAATNLLAHTVKVLNVNHFGKCAVSKKEECDCSRDTWIKNRNDWLQKYAHLLGE